MKQQPEEKESRPPVGDRTDGENSTGKVPERAGKSKTHATGVHWYPKADADFDCILRANRKDYLVLAAIYDVLLRESHRTQSLTVTIIDENIADRIGFSLKSRDKIQKRKELFVDMGLAIIDEPQKNPNSKKNLPTVWHLTPSKQPWFDKKTNRIKPSQTEGNRRRKAKKPCSRKAEIQLHGNDEKPCSQKAALLDAFQLQTNIPFQDSKEILKEGDISEDNGIHHSGGRLGAAADDSVTSLKKGETDTGTDAPALSPRLQRARDRAIAKIEREKGAERGTP